MSCHTGIEGLLTIASAIPQHETCNIEITENSKYHASVALAKIYDDLASDKERDIFREQCSAFFKSVLIPVVYLIAPRIKGSIMLINYENHFYFILFI